MTREDAIGVIKGSMPTLWKETRDAIQTLIPELAESEDKRVNEEIRNFLIDMECKREWIAYLEKQKINTEGDFARGYDCGYEACLHSHGAEFFEKQKEQPVDAKSERVIKAARKVLNNWLDGTDCPDVSGDFAELEYAIHKYDGEEKQKEETPIIRCGDGIQKILESLYNDLKRL